MPPWPIAFHLLSQKLKLGKNWWSNVVIISILIVLFYLLPWANIFLVITILKKWQKMDCFGWLRKDTLVEFVFVSLQPLSTIPFIIPNALKEIAGTVLLLLISTCVRLKNKCGSDRKHPALQALTMNVLIATIRLCPNAKIIFFGKKHNQYALTVFLERLQNEGLADRFPEEFWQGSNSLFSNCCCLTH